MKTYFCEDYLNDLANDPTSNDHYFKTVVTTVQAHADNSWYPYWYFPIYCNCCGMDSGYRTKCWFWFLTPVSGVLAGFTCNSCLNSDSTEPTEPTETTELSVPEAPAQATEVNRNNYEGAGFLLTYQNQFILSARIKKAKDAETDPIKEVEHFGGKPELEDNNDPYQTAFNELIEESGGEILDSDWAERVKILHTFQPFSQKWIWCFLLELNSIEFDRLKILDALHDQWEIGTKRSFCALTGRPTPARKAIEGIAVAPAGAVVKYIQDFKNFKLPNCDNRMKEAKVYGQDEALLFQCYRLSNESEIYQRRLRGFNLVMFEDHLTDIQKHFKNIY